MNIELTDEELNGIIDIIDGTLDATLSDVDFDHPDVQFWFGILRKCGERGEQLIKTYLESNIDK